MRLVRLQIANSTLPRLLVNPDVVASIYPRDETRSWLTLTTAEGVEGGGQHNACWSVVGTPDEVAAALGLEVSP